MRNFHKIFLHINWHCHDNKPFIQPDREPRIHKLILDSCSQLQGVECLGIGGIADHVHLVVRVRPDVLVSGLIGRLKGLSARLINKEFGRNSLHWQRGYGVVSFAERNLPGVLSYVANQKEHHQQGTTRETLEMAEIDEDESGCAG